ncbi:MAG: insulinase protein, partial [Candidatus Eremiobacteraeota bacterium]|nr:insulinase protein [Candidatus Eremiobacteraeota bacterium]
MTPPVARRPHSGLLLPLAAVLLALLLAGGIAWQFRALDMTPAAPAIVTAAEAPSSAYVLPNGMRVVVAEDRRAAIVRTMIVYRAGSDLDPAGREGLAHSLEHVMFAGTAGVPATTLYDAASRMGGQMNAFTAHDETRFVFGAPRRSLDAILAIEADRMQHLRITAQGWNHERGAVLAEIGRAQDDPLRVLVAGVRSAAYPGPAGQPSLGRADAVAKIDTGALRAAYAQRFTPANATLIVVGDVRAADVVAEDRRAAIVRTMI